MREKFKDINFTQPTLDLIYLSNSILQEYSLHNLRLTVRQLFYQLVARGHIENLERESNKVIRVVGKARLAGLIDWNHIEDRLRETMWPSHWRNPAQIVEASAQQFRIDKWKDQSVHVEVMCEKDALSGVLGPACEDLDVRFTANRGYSSLSSLYDIGKRIEFKLDQGKDVYFFYFGDHDPSGLDMDRDLKDRLSMFSGYDIEIVRLALNMDQVYRMNPPPNPAKISDTRSRAYIALFGDESWELDAIEPMMLQQIVNRAVESVRDEDLWREAVEEENKMRSELTNFAEKYRRDNP